MLDLQSARVPSVCDVSTWVMPSLAHKMGACVVDDCCVWSLCAFSTLGIEEALCTDIGSQIGLKALSMVPELQSNNFTTPSMLPVRSVLGAYACECMLVTTLLCALIRHSSWCVRRSQQYTKPVVVPAKRRWSFMPICRESTPVDRYPGNQKVPGRKSMNKLL
jgi:hypothetical protein